MRIAFEERIDFAKVSSFADETRNKVWRSRFRLAIAQYFVQAAGDIDDYKIGWVFPNDGVHGALHSHAWRLKSMKSQYLAPNEMAFFETQMDLVAKIGKRYIFL